MGLTRAYILKGPAKILYKTITYFTPDDIMLSIDDGGEDISSSMHGPGADRIVVNPKISVTFTPHAALTAASAEVTRVAMIGELIPAIFTNGFAGTPYIGTAADVPCVIWSTNGDKMVIPSAVITSPPTLTFSANKPIFGPVTITGVCAKPASDILLGAANSLYTVTGGEATVGVEWTAASSYLQRRYNGVLTAITGFTEIWPEDGWTVSFNPQWQEFKIQGLTVDYILQGMTVTASCVPVSNTMLELATVFKIGGAPGASWGQGALMSAQNAANLTIVDPSVPTNVMVLYAPSIHSTQFRFGHENLRTGELQFVSKKLFTAGGTDYADPLVVFA